MKKLLLILLLFGLETKAQINYCDSISYTVNTGSGTDLVLIGNVNIPGSSNIIYSWQACDANLCYTGSGQTSIFNQFSITDTVKVCLIVSYCDTVGCYSCYLPCDTVVWNNGWGEPQSLGIYELQYTELNNNKIFDLLGRELFTTPNRRIYIKNGKKYITNGRKP
jgi:hypothetical protein